VVVQVVLMMAVVEVLVDIEHQHNLILLQEWLLL
jgi:hypothetical protein